MKLKLPEFQLQSNNACIELGFHTRVQKYIPDTVMHPGQSCSQALPPTLPTGGSFTEGSVNLLMEPFGPFEIGTAATLYHKKSAEPRTQSSQAGPLPPLGGSIARPGSCSV